MKFINFFIFTLSFCITTNLCGQKKAINTIETLLDIIHAPFSTEARLEGNFGTINHKEFNQIKCLEIKRNILEIITSQTSLKDNNSSDAMLLHWLTNILITAPSATAAIFSWHNLASIKKRSLSDFSPEHHQIFSLPAEKITDLYNLAQCYIQNCEPKLTQDITTRIHNKWGGLELDFNQTSRSPIRSLEILEKIGITFTILDKHVNTVVQEYNKNKETILINNLKNFRLLSVNGLPESKIAFMIHDLFDHWWLTEKLEQQGILKSYAPFFTSVGNPQKKDLFCREGELIASIGFEFRLSLNSHDYKPLLSLQDICNIFNESELNNTLSCNQKQALTLLNNSTNKKFADHLPFIFSGIVIELMEQRRKNGFIKILDENNQIKGIFEALDPEYAALIVEVSNYLFEPSTKTFDILLAVMLLSEEFIEDIAYKNKKQTTIRLQDFESHTKLTSKLSTHKKNWLKNNLGSSATRKIIPIQQPI